MGFWEVVFSFSFFSIRNGVVDHPTVRNLQPN